MPVFIIYKIECLANGKVYIGQTKNKQKRWNEHKYHLRKGIHHSTHLQRAWAKFGEKNFKFSMIEECQPEELDERESYWISRYESNDKTKGYNLDGGGGTCKSLSEETKKKIGEKNKINYLRVRFVLNSEESIAKRSLSNTGKVRSEEFRSKMSILASSRTGVKNSFFNKKHTEKQKSIVSAANKNNKYRVGKQHSDESKQLMSKNRRELTAGSKHPMYGKQHTEQTKNIISAKNKGKHAHNRRKVIGVPLTGGGNIVLDFITDGVKLGFSQSGISHCISGKNKSHKGYVWKYYDQYVSEKES